MSLDTSRLHNWGRHVRVYARRGQAFSLEGNYRPPRSPEEMYAATKTKLPPVDIWDAWDIEIGCRLLPFNRHLFLRLMYVAKLDGPGICKEMREEAEVRLATRDLDAYEGMSVSLLAESMEMPAVVRMERSRRRIQRILTKHLTPVAESVS